jgi:hypothetical protein
VGVVGIISFVRHSVYFRSDQVRMGWRQDRSRWGMRILHSASGHSWQRP